MALKMKIVDASELEFAGRSGGLAERYSDVIEALANNPSKDKPLLVQPPDDVEIETFIIGVRAVVYSQWPEVADKNSSLCFRSRKTSDGQVAFFFAPRGEKASSDGAAKPKKAPSKPKKAPSKSKK